MSDQGASIGAPVGPSVSLPHADEASAKALAVSSRVAAVLRATALFLRETGALAIVVAATVFTFRDSVIAGVVVAEKDTRVFFFPLHAWIAEEVKSGRIPLWNPYIFTGYPILADGEMGLANPLQLALLYLLSVPDSFIWQRVFSVVIAAVGMYALCRALRLGPLAAIVGGLTFSLGSFFPSQTHHENVTRTAAWLPLTVAFVEWGLHRPGWRRHLFLTAAAGSLGMAAVGLHPQLLAVSLLGFAAFVVLRVALGPIGTEGSLERGSPLQILGAAARIAASRIGLIVWIGGYVSGLGLTLGAVQLLPLAELGVATYRGSHPDYFFATSYALPIQNLVNLILPYFFRGPEAQYWSLWAKWETTVYIGIAPLALAVLSAAARRREVLAFGAIALGGLWLAFASYAPVDLYNLLWQLPGFSAFRVPGRYTFLFVFAGAVLAAFGMQALHDAHLKGRRISRLILLTLIGALGLTCLGLFGQMLTLREVLVRDPEASMGWLREAYLALRHTPEGLDVREVYRGLVHSLALDTPRTTFALVTAPIVVLFILVAGFGRVTAAPARFAIIGIAALDLVWFGTGLHAKAPIGELAQETAATRFLQRCSISPAECSSPVAAASLPEWRIFTPGTIESVEFDRLVPFRIEDVGGYSSVEPRRNYAYWITIASIQNRLLDLANVRFVVYPARGTPLPSYRRVPFDPERPLMLGGKDALGGSESYAFGGEVADRLQVVGALTRAVEIPSDDVVAEITVVPRSGAPATLRLRAGAHIAEWAYDRSDVRGKVRHGQPPEIAFRRPSHFEIDGSRYDRYFYYSEFDLPRRVQVDRIDIRYVHPVGGIELYGLGLYNFDTGETVGTTQRMRSKLAQVHGDDHVSVMENAAAFPRAYVVPAARVAQSADSLSAMLDGPFDPAAEVMLGPTAASVAARQSVRDPPTVADTPRPGPVGGSTSVRSGGALPRPAELLDLGPERVRYRTSSPDGGFFVHVTNFFPGWRAYVDGVETPILLANSLFRAVAIGPGEHIVDLRYEPESVELGRVLSAWAAAVGLLTIVGALAHRFLRRPRAEPVQGA